MRILLQLGYAVFTVTMLAITIYYGIKIFKDEQKDILVNVAFTIGSIAGTITAVSLIKYIPKPRDDD